MCIRYKFNNIQPLFDLTAPDFTPLYERVKAQPELTADARLAEDLVIALLDGT